MVYGLTASIGNARMVIHTEVEEGETTVIEKYVRVNNVNDVPVQITLEPRADLVDIAEIIDESFTLEPGESKDANFIIRLDYGGTYQGQIGVGFQALEGGHGVGLSSTIIIIAEGPEDPNRVKEEAPEEEVIPEEETPEEEEVIEEPEEEVTVTVGGKPLEEEKEEASQEKKASPLVGILIVIIILVVGVIVALAAMLFLKKKWERIN